MRFSPGDGPVPWEYDIDFWIIFDNFINTCSLLLPDNQNVSSPSGGNYSLGKRGGGGGGGEVVKKLQKKNLKIQSEISVCFCRKKIRNII